MSENNLDQWLEKGIDFTNRRIQLSGEVDYEMLDTVIRALKVLEQQGNDTIHVYICSEGGDIYAAFAIYDLLRQSKCEIHTYCVGCVMSAASIIFLAGNKRSATPNSTFMFHSVHFDSKGKVKAQESDIAEGKRNNGMMVDILVKVTKINKKLAYRKIITDSGDWYIGLEEAKHLKIVNS